jgi:polysaccharide pyruvyl transferase WcaK-like protein
MQMLKSVPVIPYMIRKGFWLSKIFGREIKHCVEGYRFLGSHDLIVVSGGGQLDEEWGGPWGHPFALFKWAVLARLARIPFVFTSVGACKVTSRTSRFFLSTALRLSKYRSYRDSGSKQIAASLFHRAIDDSIVPDLAFSLLPSELPPSADLRIMAQGQTIVAFSPIAYAKPGSWPAEDRALYQRYIREMARAISQLLHRQYFIVIVWSALSDKSVLPDLIEQLDAISKSRLDRQIHIPRINSWRDLVSVLSDVDFLIASRLHSAILSCVAGTPAVMISFDPKVDRLMADLEQTEYLLHIQDFVAEDVIEALERAKMHREVIACQISAYRILALSDSARQYDSVVRIVSQSSKSRMQNRRREATP